MQYTIKQSKIKDIPRIFELYKIAKQFQETKKTVVVWPNFDRSLIKKEIKENRQWKLIVNNEIVCVWAVYFSDIQIWEERNIDPSIYIHRIATHFNYRGKKMVGKILEWAKPYALSLEKKYIRLDTLGDNKRLITYYKSFGFDFLGMYPMKNTKGLPTHYQNSPVCLFEIKLIP